MGPIRRYASPTYPTRPQASADPTLLARHVPPAWLKEGMASAASFALAAAAAGCGGHAPAAPTWRPATQPAGVVVAPIFEHGPGRASEGCIVLAPPAYLSEEQTLQIIVEELQRTPVRLAQRNVAWPEVAFPQRMTRGCRRGPLTVNAPRGKPLSVEGFDPQRRVAVKYVSRGNYADLGGVVNEGCSGWDYNFKTVAREVGDGVRAQHTTPVFLGVFYEPGVATWDRMREHKCAWEEYKGDPRDICLPEAKARQRSRELLRMQVRDFVEWLKAQGAI